MQLPKLSRLTRSSVVGTGVGLLIAAGMAAGPGDWDGPEVGGPGVNGPAVHEPAPRILGSADRPAPAPFAVGAHRLAPCALLDAHIAGLLTFGHDALAIAVSQEAAWSRFANALRAGAEPIREACAAGHPPQPPASVIDRLDEAEKRMAVSLDALRQIRPAVVEFYGVLTAEQRRQADRLAWQAPL